MHSSLLETSTIGVEDEINQFPILSRAEDRGDIPPLDVFLDDFDQIDVNNANSYEHANEEVIINEKHKRHEKNKAKEERSI